MTTWIQTEMLSVLTVHWTFIDNRKIGCKLKSGKMDDWEKTELLKEKIRQFQTDYIRVLCSFCRTNNPLKNNIKTLYGYCCDKCQNDFKRLNWSPLIH